MKNNRTALTALVLVYLFLLIVYSGTSSSFTLILHGILLIFGGILYYTLMRYIVQKEMSTKATVYFSIILAFLVFFSVLFFWFLGYHQNIDDKGLTTAILIIPSTLLFSGGFLMWGIRKAIRRQQMRGSGPNMKRILFVLNVIAILLIVFFFYNGMIRSLAEMTSNQELCGLSITLPASYMFSPGKESYCRLNTAIKMEDATLCEGICDVKYIEKEICEMNNGRRCYVVIAQLKEDATICLTGNERGLQDMASCVMQVARNTNNPTLCEYLFGGNAYVKGLDDWERDFCIGQIQKNR